MSDLSHRKVNILPVTAATLLCLCLLSFSRVGSVYGKLTDEEATFSEFATVSDASRYYDYSKATHSEVEVIEVESTIIEIPEPDPIEGYEFLGWNTCEDGTGDWYFPGELFEMTEECTDFYAIWEKILKATPSQAVKTASGSDAVFAGGGKASVIPAAAQTTESTTVPAAEQTEELIIPESTDTVTEDEVTAEAAETTDETAEATEAAKTETSEETIAETEEVTETETEASAEITKPEAETVEAESEALIEETSAETEAVPEETESEKASEEVPAETVEAQKIT